MRLIEGRDLDSMLHDGRLDPVRAVTIIEQVASALNTAHRAGLVNRDIKPSNILVGDDDFAYLIDFGIARAAGELGLTSTGTTVGTWAYMAPERFSTGHADPRSDIYALSCVLYQSLTGHQPFPGNTLEQQVAAHLVSPPPRPSAIVSGLARRFDSVIATGMAKDPAARYPTAKDLAQDAHAALVESTSGPTFAAPASVHPAPPPMYAAPFSRAQVRNCAHLGNGRTQAATLRLRPRAPAGTRAVWPPTVHGGNASALQFPYSVPRSWL